MDMRKSIRLFTTMLILVEVEYVTASGNNACKSWCADNLTPWRHPNPEIIQKCDWLLNCAGCQECLDPRRYPSSPPSTVLSPSAVFTLNQHNVPSISPSKNPASQATLIPSIVSSSVKASKIFIPRSPVPVSVEFGSETSAPTDDEGEINIGSSGKNKKDKKKNTEKKKEKSLKKNYGDKDEKKNDKKVNKKATNNYKKYVEDTDYSSGKSKKKDKDEDKSKKKGVTETSQPSLSRPSSKPSESSTSQPTMLPTKVPSKFITSNPSNKPSLSVSNIVSITPTLHPSNFPTNGNSIKPSVSPSKILSSIPTLSQISASESPTILSTMKTYNPSYISSIIPSNKNVSEGPFLTSSPSNRHASILSSNPTLNPSKDVSITPTVVFSGYPSPSHLPSKISSVPTLISTYSPIRGSSREPSSLPSHMSSMAPSRTTVMPSTYPSLSLFVQETLVPTLLASPYPSHISLPTYGDACKAWCYNKPEPWRHPDKSATQKCNWKRNCGSCPECLVLDPPSSSPPCQNWCVNHSAPWTHPDPNVSQKCRWLNNCSGCPQCETSEVPTNFPSMNRSFVPSISFLSDVPTLFPSDRTTYIPSMSPTKWQPSHRPSFTPTITPSKKPTLDPTKPHTISPTENISNDPTVRPSAYPSTNFVKTTSIPSIIITSFPSLDPTKDPLVTMQPTKGSTFHPTGNRDNDSNTPTYVPSASNTISPSVDTSSYPSFEPTADPTANLSTNPSHYLSPNPTENLNNMNATLFMSFKGDDNMTDETTNVFEKVTKGFLSDRSLGTDEASVSIVEVDVVDQLVVELDSGESLRLLSEDEFDSLVGEGNRRLQSSDKFLLLTVVVSGKVETVDSSPFPFESKVRESMENTLEDYAKELIASSAFFNEVWDDDSASLETKSLKIESESTLDSPLIKSTFVAVGGFVGSFAMLSAVFMLVRRQQSRHTNTWKTGKNAVPSFARGVRFQKNERYLPHNNHDDIFRAEFMTNPTYEVGQYPRSINLSSQDSFSTLSFPELKDGTTLIPQREDSSVFRKDSTGAWKTSLACISESSSTDDQSTGSQSVEEANVTFSRSERLYEAGNVPLGRSEQYENDTFTSYFRDSQSSSVSYYSDEMQSI